MQSQRAREIEEAVEFGLQHWRLSRDADSALTQPSELGANVLRSMPRRQPVHKIDTAYVVLPMARRVVFKPGILLPCLRLFVWLGAAIRILCRKRGGRNAGPRFGPA